MPARSLFQTVAPRALGEGTSGPAVADTSPAIRQGQCQTQDPVVPPFPHCFHHSQQHRNWYPDLTQTQYQNYFQKPASEPVPEPAPAQPASAPAPAKSAKEKRSLQLPKSLQVVKSVLKYSESFSVTWGFFAFLWRPN